ncbi:MAG TPA: tetratricopeptide repeat protein [Planctomycetes bacterium]|nr:tetratricopeptide repeat protein [Planctomycetota bacterium]
MVDSQSRCGAELDIMAIENRQDILEENAGNSGPSDSELFADEVHEGLLEREVFAGDEEFYRRLAGQGWPQTDATQTQPPPPEIDLSEISELSEPPQVPIRRKRFSRLQKLLAAGIAVVALTLLYTLLKPRLSFLTDWYHLRIAKQAPSTKPPDTDSTQIGPEQIQKPKSLFPSTKALSLKVARDFYLQKDYEQAYTAYEQLRQSLPDTAEGELLRDFLQLKMALCIKKAGNADQANNLFRTLLRSPSPVVRVLANYHLAFIELQREQYLKVRTRAYQTIVLMDAVDFDEAWASSLLPDFQFLVAESMTRHILSLCDADKDLPGRLWSTVAETDPFTNLNEAQLRSLLNSGSEQLRRGLLGPQIENIEHKGALSRWSVVCHGAAIDELLARFAANAGLNITWDFCESRPSLARSFENQLYEGRGEAADTETAKDAIRKRPVSLYLPEVTTQQFITAACGHVGLLARQEQMGSVNIFNPADYSSLSEHISLLTEEAISLWKRYLSVFHSNKRVPNARFALGLLQARIDRASDAIAEFRLVANRYELSSVAPFALLHSSKLKTNLRDYSGAREDLKQLVEQYPDSELSGQACLYLADATMKAGLLNEAQRLYSKVYHLGLSLESQADSAFGAAGCFYEEKDYESAAKWLTRYINLAIDHPDRNLYSAYFLLGKSYLALTKTKQACEAFQYSLSGPAGQLTGEEYIEAISALVEAQIQQEQFIEALTLLENVPSRRFSSKDSIEILLLKSKVLRTMGLVEEAMAVIGDKAQYVRDPQVKGRISFALAKCSIAEGNLGLARGDLAEILVLVEPGSLAHEIALELADVCLKLGQTAQTISICSQLLDLGPSALIKQKVLNILAEAYNRQKNYDRATLALLGRWNKDKAQNEEGTFDKPAATDQSPPQPQ